MMGRCRRMQRRIQSYFDGGPALGDRDVLHIHGCERCGGLFRQYSRFKAVLRVKSSQAAVAIGEPDWKAIFKSAGAEPWSAEGTEVTFESTPRSISSREGQRRVRPFFNFAIGTLPKAAVILVLVGVGTVVGVREYQMGRARSYLHSDTAAFVDSLFSSPFFPAATGTDASLVGSTSWFDASSLSPELPAPPTAGGAAQPEGQGGAPSAGY